MYGSQHCNVNLNLPLLILEPIYKSILFKKHLTTHVTLLSQSYQNANQSRIIG